MRQLPLKTVYECSKGRGTNYVRLATLYDTLTLNRTFVARRFPTTNQTPFSEITVAPFASTITPEFKQLLTVRHGQVIEGRASLLKRMKDTLKATIFESWTPGGYHAMLHSSGYDSRCISWLIKELATDHGQDWLGTIVFCCSRWEGNSFNAIMKYEGWGAHQVSVARALCRPADYYAPSLLNFRDAWAWSDGASPIAVNLFWYPVTEAIEANLLPDDEPIQVWTAQWGNTVLDAGSSKGGSKAIQGILGSFYRSILCRRPKYGDSLVEPYATVSLAKVICESSIMLGHRLRPIFLKYLDPTLAKFRNAAADGDRHRRIADWILAQMDQDYKASWYGQHVRPDAIWKHKTTEFQAFWYHWTLASFCEELHRRGIEIQ